MECKHFEIACNLIRPHRKFNADILYVYQYFILRKDESNKVSCSICVSEAEEMTTIDDDEYHPTYNSQPHSIKPQMIYIRWRSHGSQKVWALAFQPLQLSSCLSFYCVSISVDECEVLRRSYFYASILSQWVFFSLSSENLFNIKSDTFLNHPFLWVFFLWVCVDSLKKKKFSFVRSKYDVQEKKEYCLFQKTFGNVVKSFGWKSVKVFKRSKNPPMLRFQLLTQAKLIRKTKKKDLTAKALW